MTIKRPTLSSNVTSAPRVALVLPLLLPWAGAERVAATIAEELIRKGYEVDLVLANEPEDVSGSLASGVNVFKFGAVRLRNFLSPFVRYLRDRKPDAVMVLMWPLTSLSIVAHKFARSSARLIVVDQNTLSLQYASRNLAYRFALRASLSLTYPVADARVAASKGVAEDLANLSGLPRNKFEVIYNPIPLTGNDEPITIAAENAWGGKKGRRILTVGRFKAQKNHKLLIQALKRLTETVDANLMILGTGDLVEETRAFAHATGMADRILMPGQVEDPNPYYRSADIFVLSSDYEGFGNVIVEALGCGLPVVSTDCRSGPAEILDNGRYGKLVPVGDAELLARAMADSLNEIHDRSALKRRAADFEPHKAVESYINVLFPGPTAIVPGGRVK